MTLLIQLLLNALVNAAIYTLLAVGFGLVYRSMRFFHIAFGAVYITASYAVIAGVDLSGLPLYLSIIAGVIIGAMTGVVMDRIVYLPLEKRGATAGILFIASLGIYILFVNLIALIFGNEVKILSKGIEPSFSIGSLVITRMQIVQFLVGWMLVIVFWLLIRKNTFMKGIWAMGETPTLVKVLGLPYGFMRTVVFLLSSIFAGVASLLVALDVGIDPNVGMNALLTGAVAVIVGGVDKYWGWIGGAVILAVLQSIAVWQFSARWNDLITFGILIVVLLFRPQGLFSPKKRREER
ncbi:MAG: branched-chain amino acid ABC transporter permease [Thermodesulfobacteriota bacterium]